MNQFEFDYLIRANLNFIRFSERLLLTKTKGGLKFENNFLTFFAVKILNLDKSKGDIKL